MAKQTKTVKLYVVTAPVGIPGYGLRKPGEYFELPEGLALAFAHNKNLSTDAPETATVDEGKAKMSAKYGEKDEEGS